MTIFQICQGQYIGSKHGHAVSGIRDRLKCFACCMVLHGLFKKSYLLTIRSNILAGLSARIAMFRSEEVRNPSRSALSSRASSGA